LMSSQKFLLAILCTRHCGIMLLSFHQSDSASNTELRLVLSNWEAVSCRNLRIRTFMSLGTRARISSNIAMGSALPEADASWGTAILRMGGIWATRRLFNGNSFATLATLAEACALLSVILITEDCSIVLFSYSDNISIAFCFYT